jgi:hypothetical protein
VVKESRVRAAGQVNEGTPARAARAGGPGGRAGPWHLGCAGAPDCFEPMVDEAGEAAFCIASAQQLRADHRRQGERHDAGDEHRAGAPGSLCWRCRPATEETLEDS